MFDGAIVFINLCGAAVALYFSLVGYFRNIHELFVKFETEGAGRKFWRIAGVFIPWAGSCLGLMINPIQEQNGKSAWGLTLLIGCFYLFFFLQGFVEGFADALWRAGFYNVSSTAFMLFLFMFALPAVCIGWILNIVRLCKRKNEAKNIRNWRIAGIFIGPIGIAMAFYPIGFPQKRKENGPAADKQQKPALTTETEQSEAEKFPTSHELFQDKDTEKIPTLDELFKDEQIMPDLTAPAGQGKKTEEKFLIEGKK